MKKKKPKKSKSPASKSASKSALASPPSKSSDLSPDEKDLLSPAVEVVSDAQSDLAVVAVAQPSQAGSDLAPPTVATSLDLPVIVAPSTDPSAVQSEAASPTMVSDNKLVIAGTSADPPCLLAVTKPSGTELSTVVSPTYSYAKTDEAVAAAAESSFPVSPVHQVNADAKMKSLSSQFDEERTTPDAPAAAIVDGGEVIASTKSKIPVVTTGDGQIKQPPKEPADTWCDLAKGVGKRLSKKGEAFTLPSGEACIQIPNSVIEKNRKSWEPFVIGQFYSDPPSQGTLHNIVNGIWSSAIETLQYPKWKGSPFFSESLMLPLGTE